MVGATYIGGPQFVGLVDVWTGLDPSFGLVVMIRRSHLGGGRCLSAFSILHHNVFDSSPNLPHFLLILIPL
jgi:hypothetical protein